MKVLGLIATAVIPAIVLAYGLSPRPVLSTSIGITAPPSRVWAVLVVRPGQELRWLGHYKMPGIFDAEHYFLLQTKGAGTVLTQGESFHGAAL